MKMNLSVVLGMVDKASAPLKKVSGEYGYFTPRVEKAQKALKSTSDTMANISAHQKNQKALKANADQINATKERLDKYQKQIKSGKPLTAAQVAQFNKQKEKLKDLNDIQMAYKDELAKVGKQLKKAGVNTKDLAGEEKRLGVEYDQNKVKLSSLQKRYKSLNSVMNTAQKTAKKVGVGIAAGFGVAMTASAGVFTMVNSAAEEMDKLTKTAQNMKIPISMLQTLRFQSEHAGVAADTMSNAMVRYTKRLGVLQATGAGAFGSYLKKSKNPLYEELKNVKNVEQGYNKLLIAFSKLKNEQEEMAFADAAFGQDGRRMLLMLRQGTVGLSDSRKQLMELDAIISEKDTATAEAYNDALFDIKLALNAMKIKVLTPIMKQLTGTFIELIKNFKNADWRQQAISQVTEAIKNLFSAMKAIFKVFMVLVNYFPEVVAGILSAKIAMYGLNAVMLANPIGMVIALIAGLVTAIGYAATKSEWLQEKLLGLWKWIKRIGAGVGAFIAKIIKTVTWPITTLINLISKIPSNMLPSGWSKEIKEVSDYVSNVNNKLSEISNDGIKYALNGHLTPKLERSDEPLIDLAGEFKANGGQSAGIIKSPQTRSVSDVTVRVKSDLPTSIENVKTKGSTNLDVDTGGLFDFGF